MHSCPGPGTGLALSDSHHRRLLHYLATPTPTPVKKEPFVLDVGSDFCENNSRLCWLLNVGFFLGLAVLVAHVMSCHVMSCHVTSGLFLIGCSGSGARWGNLGSAKADAQRAMDIDPHHIKAYFRRAAAHKQVLLNLC